MKAKTDHHDDRLRYVYRELVRCPVCGSTERQTYRTTRYDDSKAQHTRCLNPDCQHRYIVVFE